MSPLLLAIGVLVFVLAAVIVACANWYVLHHHSEKASRIARYLQAAFLLYFAVSIVWQNWHEAGSSISLLHHRLFIGALAITTATFALAAVNQTSLARNLRLIVFQIFSIGLCLGLAVGTADWTGEVSSAYKMLLVCLALLSAVMVWLFGAALSAQRPPEDAGLERQSGSNDLHKAQR